MRIINGANILFLLQERIANDWVSLCREFKLPGIDIGANLEFARAEEARLLSHLKELREAGLIMFDENPRAPGGISGQIWLLQTWTRIHLALGSLSLAELAAFEPNRSMVVSPYFELPHKPAIPMDVFVLMPFQANLRPIYDDHIVNVGESLGLRVVRADDFFTAHAIMSDVWAAICATRAIIADCTGRNQNVFYEIGLAHVVGKPVVLITQNNDDVPFDLRHLRYIQYEYTPRGMQLFEQKLKETLKAELSLEKSGSDSD